MSMYLMKPWYKTGGAGNTFPTYSRIITSSVHSAYTTYSNYPIIEFINNYKSLSYQTEYVTPPYVNYTVSYTAPLIAYSDILENQRIYNKYSTNATIVSLSESRVSTTTAYADAYGVGDVHITWRFLRYNARYSEISFNEGDCVPLYYYTQVTNTSSVNTSMLDFNSAIGIVRANRNTGNTTYPNLINATTGTVRTLSVTSNYKTYKGYGFGATAYDIVYAEWTDPYKVTIKLANDFTIDSRKISTLSNQVVTFYRATLTNL